MVFFTGEIGKKGPKNGTGPLNQGAVLDKSILTMSILANGLLD
jgi:hypothetical protein